MYSVRPGLILAFHGCDRSVAQKVLNGETMLKNSTNKYDWLGHVLYNKLNILNIMVYVAINEKKAKGKALLKFLKDIDEDRDFVNFMDEEEALEFAINDAMKTPRVKSGNSLREILSNEGL